MPTGQPITTQWLSDNVAAFGGPPYLLNQASSNGGNSYPVPSGGAYYLATDVTALGTGFVVSGPGTNSASSLDINGHTVIYGNAALPFAEDFEDTTVSTRCRRAGRRPTSERGSQPTW